MESSSLPPSLMQINKLKSTSFGGDSNVEKKDSISNHDLDAIVGVGDSSELEEMEPLGSLLCKLRSYQKQTLYWMIQLERGHYMDEAASTLHPCWDAYHLGDRGDWFCTKMPFQLMQQQNFLAHFRWLEEEYVDSLFCFICACVRFTKYNHL